jgi:hypothetical protein
MELSNGFTGLFIIAAFGCLGVILVWSAVGTAGAFTESLGPGFRTFSWILLVIIVIAFLALVALLVIGLFMSGGRTDAPADADATPDATRKRSSKDKFFGKINEDARWLGSAVADKFTGKKLKKCKEKLLEAENRFKDAESNLKLCRENAVLINNQFLGSDRGVGEIMGS